MKKGLFALQVHGKAGKSLYEIEMHRLDKRGDQVFEHKGLSIGSSDVLLFDYGSWKGNGNPIGVSIDKNGDGKPDSTQQISDEK